ncbi:hypothetical protein CGRA01v4_14923 [Colletotrichum graminicola]|nr:hypothetical protein CGRA01v4_14923 [Colletotrichum graminicola]
MTSSSIKPSNSSRYRSCRRRTLASRVRISGSSGQNPSTILASLFLIRHLGTRCRGRRPLLRRLTSVPVPSTTRLVNRSHSSTPHHQTSLTHSPTSLTHSPTPFSRSSWILPSGPAITPTPTAPTSLRPWTCQCTLLFPRGPPNPTALLPTRTAATPRWRRPTPIKSSAGSGTPSPRASTDKRKSTASMSSRACSRK